MPQTDRVTSSRRAAPLALLATVLVIGALAGLRWISAADPTSSPANSVAPTAAALVPTGAPAPSATPSATPAVTPAAGRSPAPTADATATPRPTARPTDGLVSPRVLTTAEFQAAFVSKLPEFVGATVLVHGRIEGVDEVIGGQGSADLGCDGEPACVYGALAGASTYGGSRPLLIWSRRIPTPLGPDDVADAYFWPSLSRTELPIEGTLVLRIDTTYSVEYLGRAVTDAAGSVWTPSSVLALERTSLALYQVMLVDGWLGESTIQVVCPPPDSESLLPSHFCGEQAWLSDDASDTGPVLTVQPDAYRQFAPNPTREPGDRYVPQRGLMAVGVRLERDGCETSPCPAWHVLGWVTPHPDISSVIDSPAPTAVPDTGWIELAPQAGVSASWSPDSDWLLVTGYTEILLVDGRSGEIVRTYERVAGMASRGAVWVDGERFLIVHQRPDDEEVHDGMAVAQIGRVDSDDLVDVEVPVGYGRGFGSGLPYVAMVDGGAGAIAFLTTDDRKRGCGPDGCWTYRIWTSGGTSNERSGLPITWSPAGDRLAVIHKDRLRSDRQAGMGAGFRPYQGWLEVVSWPDLRTVFADRHIVVQENSGFDPTGRLLASQMGDLRVVDTSAGTVNDLEVGAYWWDPVWDSAGNLMVANEDGDVTTFSPDGEEVSVFDGTAHRIVGSADGSVQLGYLWDPIRASPPGVFTEMRGVPTYQVGLPSFEPDTLLFEPSVAPDGHAFVIEVERYDTTSAQLLFHLLE